MVEKKIVLFLVEGTSDIEALESCFEEIYEKYNIEFKPLRFDITAHEDSTCHNIEKLLLDRIEAFLSKHSEISHKDILEVIQIVDMDGAGVPSERVKKSETGKTTYTDEFIFAKDRDRLIARNLRKRAILCKLKDMEAIYKYNRNKECKYSFPYHIFYFSRNLEHALYNMAEEYTREEKERLASDFADNFDGREKEFIEFLKSPEIMTIGTYTETWKTIFEGLNSLHRGSNVHLIFEELPFA